MHKLYLVMVGLPARGKSRLARRICGGLAADGFRTSAANFWGRNPPCRSSIPQTMPRAAGYVRRSAGKT